jgi:hypothetical protein
MGNVGSGHCPLGLRDGVTEEKAPGEGYSCFKFLGRKASALDHMATFLGDGKL